ncbi:MAG: copper chaperone PCu(A)C [Chloroflexota bacterium]
MRSRSVSSLVSVVVLTVAVAVAAATLAACSTGGTSGPTISDAWVRPAMGPDRPAAAYLVITNRSNQADALLSVSIPGASSVEIHETTTDASGMMGMHPISRLEVPAGGTVKLEPGGYHLMIMGLTTPLEVGSKVKLELVFERAGTVVVEADVRQG